MKNPVGLRVLASDDEGQRDKDGTRRDEKNEQQ
jgi:hypothetical protein